MRRGHFKIEQDILYYKKEKIIEGVDELFRVGLEIALTTPPPINKLDLDEEEELFLEELLNTYMFEKGDLYEE